MEIYRDVITTCFAKVVFLTVLPIAIDYYNVTSIANGTSFTILPRDNYNVLIAQSVNQIDTHQVVIQ
jgi:hypothetical protein